MHHCLVGSVFNQTVKYCKINSNCEPASQGASQSFYFSQSVDRLKLRFKAVRLYCRVINSRMMHVYRTILIDHLCLCIIQYWIHYCSRMFVHSGSYLFCYLFLDSFIHSFIHLSIVLVNPLFNSWFIFFINSVSKLANSEVKYYAIR